MSGSGSGAEAKSGTGAGAEAGEGAVAGADIADIDIGHAPNPSLQLKRVDRSKRLLFRYDNNQQYALQ